jgi:hypothetical protein
MANGYAQQVMQLLNALRMNDQMPVGVAPRMPMPGMGERVGWEQPQQMQPQEQPQAMPQQPMAAPQRQPSVDELINALAERQRYAQAMQIATGQ